MKTLTSILVLLFGLQAATAQPLQRVAPEQAGLDSRKLMYADEAIETAIAGKEIPGAVLAVVRNGKMAYLKAYGNKRIYPDTEPMTVNTVFDMASCSKSISTAVCTMILAERGKIRLLDPVSRYIPDFKDWESEDGKDKKVIRIADLLTHSSGLPPYASAAELEQKYGLVPSTKEERKASGAMTAVEYRKGDLKHQIANVVRPALQDYRFRSFREFKALLGLFNVTVEEVRKSVDGRICHGLVYAALDEKGRRCGVGIKSSDIGRSVGYEALKRKCARSKTWMKAHPVQESTKEAIREALRQDTRQGFLRLLAEKGVVPILWENEQGVIYGVTYIDHGSRTVFKGSALGREFSASVLNRLYGTPLPMAIPHGDASLKEERARGETGLAEGLLDILTTESRPYPGEETVEGPYGKRKKKRKRRGPHIG